MIDCTVVIPTIPPREKLLWEAIQSVTKQTLKPSGGIIVELDQHKEGAATVRGRGLAKVTTEWVAFLDDDDYWYPNHLENLWNLYVDTGAWYLWSWFDGNNPFPMHRGRKMDLDHPHATTMNVLVRTEMAQSVGFTPHPDQNAVWAGEDWQFQLGCIEYAREHCERPEQMFAGSPEITWHYRVHKKNTSGLPTRW